MKRKELIRYLQRHGCKILREGTRHSWWHNTEQNKRSAVPLNTDTSPLRSVSRSNVPTLVGNSHGTTPASEA